VFALNRNKDSDVNLKLQGEAKSAAGLLNWGMIMSEPIKQKGFTFKTLVTWAIAAVIFIGGSFVLWHDFHALNWSQVHQEIVSWGAGRIIAATCLALLSYSLLALGEGLGVRWLGYKLPIKVTFPISFSAYALAHSLGANLLTGSAIRWRAYQPYGLTGADIIKLTGFCGIGFLLGAMFVGGAGLLLEPSAMLAALPFPVPVARGLGAGGVLASFVYVGLCAANLNGLSVFGHAVALPNWQVGCVQLAICIADNFASAGLVYVLMPNGVGFGVCSGAYVLATIAGWLSALPGGIGAFEASMSALLPAVPRAGLAAALIGYRWFYYVIPLVIGLCLLGWREWATRKSETPLLNAATTRWLSRLTPPIMSSLVLAAAVVLLLSGATPIDPARRALIGAIVPLPLIEAAHLSAGMVAVGLAVLAIGLWQRLQGAQRLTTWLLFCGAAFSIFKGLDWEEATTLLVIACVLWMSRGAFYRRSRLVAAQFSPAWLFGIGILVAGSIWVGLNAFAHVPYSSDLWTQFALRHGDAPRFLRTSAAMTAVLIGFSIWILISPGKTHLSLTTLSDINDAFEISARSHDSNGFLATTGDKALMFNEARTAFIQYATSGTNWITFGDPIGDPNHFRALLWQFAEAADRAGARVAIYQGSVAYLPLYADLGLVLMKLGEEAHIDLPSFSLEGSARRQLRQQHARGCRDGLSMQIVTAGHLDPYWDQISHISEAWLVRHGGKEKGFSLGWFDHTYLDRFDIALIWQADEIVAFANILRAGTEELSIDLMRHDPDRAPTSAMTFLFVELMLWGSKEGIARFNLGMAPLTGLADHPLAPFWHKLGAMVRRVGATAYNFDGLRSFKDKFSPDWGPRYLAAPAGISAGTVLLRVTRLIGQEPAPLGQEI
jgi:phosphatidylglycerol lysyltransferase